MSKKIRCFGGSKIRTSANTQSNGTNKAKALLRRLERLGVK